MPAIDTTVDAPERGVVVVSSTTAAPAAEAPDLAPARRPSRARGQAAAAPATTPAAPATLRVWDAFVRTFHWLLAVGVGGLVVSAQSGQQEIHMALGLAVVGLLAARLTWGFVGSGQARFASFAVSPFEAVRYLGEIAAGRPRHYLGHNPAGAWMVFVLLGVLGTLGVSGLALQATVEFEGPLVEPLRWVNDQAVHEIAIAHRLAINALYLLVPLHVAGVVLASVQHRENLVLAMITGRKRATGFPHPRTHDKE